MAEVASESDRIRVVLTGGDRSTRADAASELDAGREFDVQTERSVVGVREAVADEEVTCVVTGASLEDGDWRDVVETVRDADSDLPVVLYPAEPDPEVASEATAAGVDEYLPRPHDDGAELRERLRSAAADYERIRRLRSRSIRYDQLMETIPHSFYFKDTEGRFVDASENLLDDLDVDPIGKTDADLWGDPDDPTGLETYRDDLEVIETGEPIVGKEERHRVQEGDVWVESSKFPLTDEDGEVVGLFGISRNVTGQKSREKELRHQSQRLEQFASFVSHDLRNPINIAQGYLDRAIEDGDEAALEQVEGALERMESLVDDLLTTVREGNETQEWVDFPGFVQRVWTATETDHASLRVEIPENTTIAAVPGQFRQLLDNLFRNADEHAGPDVTVTVGVTDEGFYVEDDGPGVDPAFRDRVFEYGHSEGGTGIGLTITREIAASHGWDVSLEESAAGGARFEFSDCLVRRDVVAPIEEGEEVPIDETTEIGDPTPRGHVDPGRDDGTWTIAAGGENVWMDVEEHFFAYGTVDGDVRIDARVAQLEEVDEYSKAGVMVRDWPGEGSPLAYVGATPGHGPETILRPFPGEDIETEQFESITAVPRWYRLEVIDTVASLQMSPDGEDWTRLERRAIAANDPLSVGLAVCSRDPERTCEAVFEDVRVVRLRPGESEE